MIYCYCTENFVYQELLKALPIGSVMNLKNPDKLRKLAKHNDLVLFWGWGNGDRKLQRQLYEKGVELFPRCPQSFFIENRGKQLRELDFVTKYPLQRVFVEGNGELKTWNTPSLVSDKVVVKIGNEHQGQSKYLKKHGAIVRTRENVVFEEFMDNARSIRICMITDNTEDMFVVDYIKDPRKISYEDIDQSWIGNVDCTDIPYSYDKRYELQIPNIDDIVEDALKIKDYLKTDYLGIDYVINDRKIGFLEANDMIGLPYNELVHERAKIFFLKLCKEHVNKRNG